MNSGDRFPREGEAPAEPLTRENVLLGLRLSRSLDLPDWLAATPKLRVVGAIEPEAPWHRVIAILHHRLAGKRRLPMQCMGLDIGSTSIKGAVLDLASGQVHSIVKEPFPEPLHGLPTGWFEIDPLEVIDRSRRVISQLLALAPEAKSLFLCGQMGGVVVVDQDNHPTTNYLSWRDQRTLSPHPSDASWNYLDAIQWRVGELWMAGQEPTVRYTSRKPIRCSGNELKSGSMTSLLFWLQQSSPFIAGLRPSTIGDFVVSQLTGSLPRMERTQAIGLIDLSIGGWDELSFRGLELDNLDWGQLASIEHPVANCHIDGRKLTVYPTLGDQHCAERASRSAICRSTSRPARRSAA